MILETLVTTLDAGGRTHCAPMGIALQGDEVVLRPFRTAATCRNLVDLGEGVVNFTDDVLLLARAALEPVAPPVRPATRVRPPILGDACSWREFQVTASDLSLERALLRGRVVAEGRARDFLGFNRAQHAVIEATILATRLHLSDRGRVLEEFGRLRPLVDKTGGPREIAAFEFVTAFVAAAPRGAAVPTASGGGR